MKYFLILFILLGCSHIPKNEGIKIAQQHTEKHDICKSPQVRIAVIDTGFGIYNLGHSVRLCQYGHKNFTKDIVGLNNYGTLESIPQDTIGHGTNIAGIIDNWAKQNYANYCILIYKIYHTSYGRIDYEDDSSQKAIKYALEQKVDVINYSGGGAHIDLEERKAIKNYLDWGGEFFASAGNDGYDFDKLNYGSYQPLFGFYPAMYDKRIHAVGGLDKYGNKWNRSNTGSYINQWELASEVEFDGLIMSGTSQSAATATGKFIKDLPNRCKKDLNFASK